MEDKIKELAITLPFSVYELKKLKKDFNLSYKDLKNLATSSSMCGVSMEGLMDIFKEFETFKQLDKNNCITEDLFYNKELSDTIRDIVKYSACNLEDAVCLLTGSKDYKRDSFTIKKLKNCGVSTREVKKIIRIINNS